MASAEESEGPAFDAVAPGLLEEIAKARKRIADVPGALSGDLEHFRDRIDHVIRESEVDNRRQVRIFLRDVDGVANDLAKAAKDHRLSTRHLAIFDACLRRLRKRDFYAARKVWHKFDKFLTQVDEVRRLQGSYREKYRAVEARIRDLRARVEHLRKVPKPDVSAAEADAFVGRIDAFNEAAQRAYLDFLARARADTCIPLLYETTQGRGVGIPGPPQGCDPEPLLRLLSGAGPGREDVRARSFYGLLELPSYSDAKLTHLYEDSRLIRGALDAAWPWLKAIRDDERRSLLILWSDDPGILRRRVPAILEFLGRTSPGSEALERGNSILEDLVSGRFEVLQRAARLYATYGADAEGKFSGRLEEDVEAMSTEAGNLAGMLKKFPDPMKVESGSLN